MIDIEDRNGISILRMVAGRGNALSLDLATALVDSIAELQRSPSRAVVLTGQGSLFGAGVDLRAIVDGGPDYVRRFLPVLVRTFELLATFPKPVVAAVNGHAIAGGAILMLACDQRLLARGTARVGLTEVLVGVQFPAWALEIARFATPREHFSSLILTGRTWLPDDALARGLVDELVDADRLLDRACEVADELAGVRPKTFAATKLAVRRPMIEAVARQSAEEREAVIDEWCSAESLAQVALFAARTLGRR